MIKNTANMFYLRFNNIYHIKFTHIPIEVNTFGCTYLKIKGQTSKYSYTAYESIFNISPIYNIYGNYIS